MTERRFGLRVRILATLTGAAMFCGGLLTVVLLLQARDAIVRRHLASVRQESSAVASSMVATCAGSAACQRELARAGGFIWKAGARCEPPARTGPRVSVCREASGGTLAREVDLAPAAEEARALVAPVLASVSVGLLLLVALVFWLLDRQLVAPLARIDDALDRISSASAGETLLTEGGDLLGRLAPAVNRLDLGLREERGRVQAQIALLERSNAELRTAREEMARSERLASVGRLAAGVAHEVGNPMTALIGFLSILQDRVKQGRDPGDYLERMGREAARIDRILRDLLDLARPPPGELQAVDLRAAVESARSLIEAQPTWTGCTLAVRIPPDLPPACADAHYVVQVLLNLLANAAKAGAGAVEVAGRHEAGAPILEVSDDGRGLPPEAASRLFEPFFTTSASGQGTGLGLALCHATMERFGGSIEAAPGRHGRGATFTLRFAAWRS